MRAPFAIALRIVRQLTRDRRTIAMILVVPIIIILLFGYALQGESHNNPVIIVNLDKVTAGNVSIGDRMVEHLRSDDRVEVREVTDDFAYAIQKVHDRTVRGAILIPENTSHPLLHLGTPSVIVVAIDEAEPSISSSIIAATNQALQTSLSESGVVVPIEVKTQLTWGLDTPRGLDISLPPVIGFVIMFLVLLLSLLLLVREDTEGTKARFFAAPVSRWQILGGYVLGMTFFGLLISAVVMSISLLVFGVTIRGDLWLVAFLIFLFAVGVVMLAVLLSRLAKNEFQAVQLAPMIALPSMALSGFIVPVATLPGWLQVVSNFIPLTYAIDALRTVMLRGGGVQDIALDLVALGIFALLAFVGAALVSRETIA